ncbi:MAG: hypothetical protein A2X34_03875 [Elusimicrobia bacterium GWC2_51_8]|nr:MAG: hypothetical protein A2X33_08380 [Elusimicrobia bacterium GWA2_51_34]OGR58944.1 MAG: hypothetical protein A2X34_03875 [Elusimicrobia bacterium GWC2_51_8]OGR85254.1 MAG: hypothetical protein A2021_02355 [Elusimicrobia bacterium GWF2_52_66]
MPSLRFNLSVFFFILFGGAWSLLTIWAGYTAGRHFDYYATKMDNKILRSKMASVSEQVEQGLAYLEMTKKTDTQLRKVLGMRPELQGEVNSLGGADASDLTDFRKMLSQKAEEIKEKALSGSISKMQEESRKRLSSYSEITWYLANRHNSVRATPSMRPAQGRITSSFGYRLPPLRMASEYHSGIDIASDAGSPIHVTADGVVRHSGWAQGYGMCVVVDHGFGYSTLYGHMNELLVKEGTVLKRGQLVGRMGSTGTSTGNHLHYEVWVTGVPKNPIRFFEVGAKDENLGGFFDGIFGSL